MTSSAKIWICAAFQPVYRCGGWAYVRLVDGQASGAAGGERNTTAARTALAGLIASLRALPVSAAAEIRTDSRELVLFKDVIANLGGGGREPASGPAPEDDLDLWAQVMTASTGRRVSLVPTPLKPGVPLAFAAAWAELGRDKAKATGAFTSAIPKPNLAKLQGLA